MPMKGYADSTVARRLNKARKIEAILGGVDGLDLLDLGAGSGFLSNYFAERGARVVGADREVGPYVSAAPFVCIDGPALPVADNSFDVVVFNHVIEHVGPRPAQDAMLAEIARVLRPTGRLYLAAPNRWSFVEPHFRLPLLSVLPRRAANAMVRMMGKGPEYDCFPLGYFELRRLISGHFHNVADRTTDALRLLLSLETPLPELPTGLLRPIAGALPTLVFVGSRPIR